MHEAVKLVGAWWLALSPIHPLQGMRLSFSLKLCGHHLLNIAIDEIKYEGHYRGMAAWK